MKMYHIDCKTEAEKKEAIELFEKLGYWNYQTDDSFLKLRVHKYGEIQSVIHFTNSISGGSEETTLQQLREMVGLKMKEYLERQIDGSYKLIESDSGEPDWIKVPNKANRLTIDGSKTLTFWKDHKTSMNVGKGEEWLNSDTKSVLTYEEYCEYDYKLLWQRHTQPEELPFIDDEPKTVKITTDELRERVKHNHYFKDVSNLDVVDVYQVLKLFNVTDPCLQHIIKKALCAGERGHKDFSRDLQDIFDTAKRALEINNI